MPDISQQTSQLRSLPDQALQHELTQPSGLVPSYLVLAEAQRRQLMRSAAQKEQSQGQSGTVMDDIVRNMMAGQPAQGGPPPPAGMVPPAHGQQGPPGMPGAGPPSQMAMARGGVIRFADGDLVSDPGAPPGGWLEDPNEPINALPGITNPGLGGPSSSGVDDWIDKYSRQFHVDPNLARAVMQQESGRKGQSAVSPKGARGRFQLMPGTAKELGVDPNDPEGNVKGGIQYLGQQLDRFGDVPTALAAYNAGPGAVIRYGGIPPFSETEKYVAKIRGNYDKLARVTPTSNALVAQLEQKPPAQPTPDQKPADQTGEASRDQTPPPDQAAADGGADQPITKFVTEAHPGRIHQNISDLDVMKADIQKRISALPDPYSDENMAQARQKFLPAVTGHPANYLDSLSQQADTRAATIAQLQGEILQRYHNPNPWEFLANIGAGMASSKQLSVPLMFAQGVGQAWQARDQDQQNQVQNYDALEKMRLGAYTNVEAERGRMNTMLAGLIEHQATQQQANRKLLEDQLYKVNAEQDKWKQRLVPTNKLEPLINPDDYSTEEVSNALSYQAKAKGWSKDRELMERNARQALAVRGDQWMPGTQYGSAYDQFMAKYPKEVGTLDVKASKYAPSDIASYAKTVNAAPEGLYDPHVVPKDAQTAVRDYMTKNDMRLPVRPPNKQLADQAALSLTTLTHADRLGDFAKDPWLVNNVFGPWMGRLAKGEEKVGMDALTLDGATPQQQQDAQNFLTSLEYLRMREGKSLFGGRPPQTLMQDLKNSSPNANMAYNRFIGALGGVRASANMAIQASRAYMYGEGAPISSVPQGGRVVVDQKTGRQAMQSAPGEPWYYMDNHEPVKKAQ